MEKDKCTLTDEELINKVIKTVSNLCSSGGRSWVLQVPVNFNKDPDMLILELASRFIENTTEKAVAQLIKSLKEDDGYYIGWKSNIAMAFKDEYTRYENEPLTEVDIHKIANTSADNFLKQLITNR